MAGRHANGEGSIYRRKDGRYEAACVLLTPDGTRKRIRVYGRTRLDADTQLTEAKAKALAGVPVPERRTKLADYLDYWFENFVRPNRRPTTFERYETTVRLYLKPGLGRFALTELTVPVVQAFINRHIAAGHSIRSAQIVRTVLGAALTRAQREELVTRNVARLVELPHYERGEIVPWTVDEARAFLAAASSDPLSTAFTLMAIYGLRRGEVLGLRWQDVDFDQDVIRVRQQIQRIGGALQAGPVKTSAGRRDLPMLQVARAALLLHRDARRAAVARREAEAADLVFATRSGQAIEPRNFVRSFKRICTSHGVRPIKLHHVRHTAATLLKDAGVPARDTQLILGHANLSTTLEIYQHDSLETRRKALTKIEGLFQAADGSGRCRQKLPSNDFFVDEITSSVSGSGGGTRTHGVRLMSSIDDSFAMRVTEVNRVVNGRRRLWLAGAVAVKIAVTQNRRHLGCVALELAL